jgi:acyl carrier protein
MNIEKPVSVSAENRLIDRLADTAASARREVLAGFLREQLGQAIGIDAIEIGPEDKLMDLGVDSLRAVEIKLLLESELDIALSSSLLFDYPTLEGLVDFLLEEAGVLVEPPRGASTLPMMSAAQISDDVSEERLAELLSAELADLGIRTVGLD